MKCQIKWVDDNGNPTPDDNDAVGYATHTCKSLRQGTRTQRFAICAEHLLTMPIVRELFDYPGTGPGYSGWSFEGFKS